MQLSITHRATVLQCAVRGSMILRINSFFIIIIISIFMFISVISFLSSTLFWAIRGQKGSARLPIDFFLYFVLNLIASSVQHSRTSPSFCGSVHTRAFALFCGILLFPDVAAVSQEKYAHCVLKKKVPSH